MSEARPVYIPCASGNNAQTDCLVTRHGALVRLMGHPSMDFTAADAAHLSWHLLGLARACGWVDPLGEIPALGEEPWDV